jgi:hypothetical protein
VHHCHRRFVDGSTANDAFARLKMVNGGRALPSLMSPSLMLRLLTLGSRLRMPGRPMLFLDSSQMDRTTIPPGDRGEQLIANLILSSIAYQFDAVACARVYAAHARAIALALHDRNLTYCPPRPSRFLRLSCDLGGETESLVLSVIEGTLVAPILRATRDKSDLILTEALVGTVDLDIEHVSLHLRLRRLAQAIEPVERLTSPKESALIVGSIIADNLRYKLTSTEPLDRAIDFLSLGRDLVGRRNFALAAVCLEKAQVALNAPMAEMATACASGVQEVKEQIARTIDELRRSAL